MLERYGVEMIGCDLAAIERGEDRKLFNEAMAELGLEVARSGYAYSVEDALAIVSRLAEMTERVKVDGPDRRMAPCDAEGAGR